MPQDSKKDYGADMITNTPKLLLAHAFMATLLAGRAPTQTFDMSCIVSLELPTTGLLAPRAEDSGTVRAVVHIGEAGHPSKVDLMGGNKGLQGDVQVAMKLSDFAPDCEGRTLEFVFAFTLEGPPTHTRIPPGVTFKPPNRFDLVFRRLKPNIEHPPPPAPRLK
jgi:hypothetical protein